MKANDYNDIGQYLKDVRESLKLSASEAGQAIHIRRHYIEALESGELEKLPGKAYVRGYIKNYALFLGINVDEVLMSYDGLLGPAKPELFIPEPTVKENLPSRKLMLSFCGGAVLVFGLYAWFGRETVQVISPISEVPSNIMLEVQRSSSPRSAEWVECLNSFNNECFNYLFIRDVLEQERRGYKDSYNLLIKL